MKGISLEGIKERLIIVATQDIGKFEELLRNWCDYGISLKHKIQSVSDGLAQAFILCEEFMGDDNVIKIVKSVKLLHREELEIRFINQEYLNKNEAHVKLLEYVVVLLDIGLFVQTIEKPFSKNSYGVYLKELVKDD